MRVQKMEENEEVPKKTAENQRWKGKSLLRRRVGEGDALLDVALEAVDGLGQELLLLLRDVTQGVDGLLGSVGLGWVSQCVNVQDSEALTPSSMGTEKKSVPVCCAISLPPGTPGR